MKKLIAGLILIASIGLADEASEIKTWYDGLTRVQQERDTALALLTRRATEQQVTSNRVDRTQTHAVAREQAFLAALDAQGITYRLPFTLRDSDGIEQQLDAKMSTAATVDEKQQIMYYSLKLIKAWMSFRDDIYDEHFGQSNYWRVVTRTVPVVASSLAEQNGWTTFDSQPDRYAKWEYLKRCVRGQ